MIPKTDFRPKKIVLPKAGVVGAVKPPLAAKTKPAAAKSRPRRRNGAEKGKAGVSPVSHRQDDRDKLRATLQSRVLALKKIREDAQAFANKAERQLNNDFADWQRWGKGVDTAATVATIMSSLTKLVRQGYKAAASHGDELKAINREVLKDVVKSKGKMALELSEKLGAFKAKEDTDSAVLAFGKVAVDSWFKMNSPSFWASTVVQLVNGASWNEAVTTNPGDIRDQAIRKLRRTTNQSLNELDQKIRKAEQALTALESGQ